jgi:NAD-dependent histone deacetylase SIR2
VRARDVEDETPDQDGPPPMKRQRIMKTKELKTEYLNLKLLNETNDELHHKAHDAKLKKLTEVLRTKRKIVVIAGAGISVSAGSMFTFSFFFWLRYSNRTNASVVPDFRSSKGLFTTLRNTHKLKSSGKHLFDADVYRNDASTSSFHDMVRELSHLTQNAKPTPFHDMLATLAEEGRLMRLYTQNVDGIDTALQPLATKVPLNRKGPWPKAIQLHGGLGKMVCSKCKFLLDFDGSLFEGPEAPPCPECETVEKVREIGGLRGHGVGRLRPRMVLYNEHNPDEEAIGAVSTADLKTRPDAVIVVGTSLKVPGVRRLAKEMCSVTRGRRGGFTAWINFDSEPTGVDFKDCWDMVVCGACDDVARLAALPKWDDKDCGDFIVLDAASGNDKNTRPEVVLDSKTITAIKAQGMMTPTDSPREQSPTPSGPAKLKQAPLSFGTSTPGVINQKTARKPLPAKPTKAPNSKITNAFTATKVAKNSVGRPKKITGNENLFPGLPASPSSNYKKERINLDISIDATQPYSRRETISPKSKPSGMANLIS